MRRPRGGARRRCRPAADRGRRRRAHPDDVLIGPRDHRHADARQPPVQRPPKLGGHARRVGAGPQGQDELADPSAPAARRLHGGQRRVEHRVSGLGSEVRTRAGDEELLGLQRLAHHPEPPAARDGELGGDRQVVVLTEVPLHDGHRPSRVGGQQVAPLLREAGVDVAARAGHGHADELTGDEDAARRRRGVDLRRDDQPLLSGGDEAPVGDGGRGVGEGAGRDRPSGGERDPQIVHPQQREARVVRPDPPALHAAEPGGDARRQGDDERERDDEHPPATQVPDRPPQPEARTSHRPTSAVPRCRPDRRGADRRRRCARSRARPPGRPCGRSHGCG